jgi:hypothetical protein
MNKINHKKDVYQLLNILNPRAFPSLDDWYDYLVDDYIPNQRPQDMQLFIQLCFDPTQYILYRIAKEHMRNGLLRDMILDKFKQVHEGVSDSRNN